VAARCAAGIAGMVRRSRGGAVGLCAGCCAGGWEEERKKMIILQVETTEHRELRTSAPQGEPGSPPSVLTPQSPCTTCTTRAVGVGTLYQDTIYAAAARTKDKCNARPSAQDGGGHQSRRAGGASLCRGTPALHRAMLGRQFSCNVRSKVIIE
jgi:hypothetical protein